MKLYLVEQKWFVMLLYVSLALEAGSYLTGET